MVWHIGNTTIRTPYRLRAALVSLSTSHLHGNLLGRDNEQSFADLLHDQGLVQAARREWSQENERSDLGRKWRVALSQLGFVTCHLTKGHRQGVDQKLEVIVGEIPGLTGRPYEITPAGRLLIESQEMVSQQESFLRALAAYRIPSQLEPRYSHKQFSPLRFVLEVFRSLTDLSIEPFISFDEMALIVQRSTADDGAVKVAESIQKFRATHEETSASTRRRRYSQAYEEAVLVDDPSIDPHQMSSRRRIEVRGRTLRDYADLNLRYLKATGLFKSRGRGFALSPERAEVIQHLADEPPVTLEGDPYLRQLWHGAVIPTDRRETAISVIRSLEEAILQKGAELDTVEIAALDDERLTIHRHGLEANLQQVNEEDFARQQVDQVAEIVGYIDAILARGSKVLPDGREIFIPSGERPAYFEWVIWRAFLAMNSLANKPWEARRFAIDHDLLPVAHAPGGGPDMSFEFEDTIVVVEVTLTSSSRQEAAEGEPVRRHVAKYAEENTSEKAVYGLFIAPSVDTNTAHTFRSGDWYKSDDSKINVHIVPMRLEDFRDFFGAVLPNSKESHRQLRELLMECRMEANQEAPLWKKKISELTKRTVEALNRHI